MVYGHLKKIYKRRFTHSVPTWMISVQIGVEDGKIVPTVANECSLDERLSDSMKMVIAYSRTTDEINE